MISESGDRERQPSVNITGLNNGQDRKLSKQDVHGKVKPRLSRVKSTTFIPWWDKYARM